MGQWSWKCPGSPHRQQAGPGLTAAPAAEGKARDCRREDGGAAVGSAPPPHRGHRSPWPLPLLGGARGAACTRDLGAGTGREREGREGGEREGERERLIRGSPTPGHATIWSSASWMACVSDVGRWHWTHSAVRRGSRTMNCSSTTRSLSLLCSRSPSLPFRQDCGPFLFSPTITCQSFHRSSPNPLSLSRVPPSHAPLATVINYNLFI